MKMGGEFVKTLFSFAERLVGPLLRISLGLVLLWIGAIHLATPQPVVRLLSLSLPFLAFSAFVRTWFWLPLPSRWWQGMWPTMRRNGLSVPSLLAVQEEQHSLPHRVSRETAGEQKMDDQIQRQNATHVSYSMADDLLTQPALVGDQGSFEALLKKYEHPLRGYIKTMLKDDEQIDDILQYVFLQFYVSLPKLKACIPLKAWQYRVAYNRCVDELRKNHRRQVVSFSQLEGEDGEEEHLLAETLPDMHLTPEEILE